MQRQNAHPKMAHSDHSGAKVNKNRKMKCRQRIFVKYSTEIFFIFILFLHSEHIFQYQNKKDDDTERPSLDYVLDVTVAYPDKGIPLDLPTIVTGTRPACKTHFLYRLYHTSEVSLSAILTASPPPPVGKFGISGK